MSQNIHLATDFKENSMASRMSSGDSKDLNCIKIDPWTGEKFSLNVDIVAATSWQHPQQCTFIHARESFHVLSNGGVFVIVLCITSVSTNEMDVTLTTYKNGSRPRVVSCTTTFWVPVWISWWRHTLTLYCKTARLRERHAAFPSFTRYYYYYYYYYHYHYIENRYLSLLTCKSSFAVPLFSGFFTRHFETKSMKSCDHLSGCLKEGGGLVGIINIACKRKTMENVRKQ